MSTLTPSKSAAVCFRDFVFTNPTTLWTGMNPDFFKGTVVEQAVSNLLADGTH